MQTMVCHVKGAVRGAMMLALFTAVLGGGCEQGKDDTVSGAVFNRSTPELRTVSIPPDSFTVTDAFTQGAGSYGSVFAGKVGDVNAVSVFKFARPSQATIDKARAAEVSFTVRDYWPEGTFSFGLYSTASDWDETTVLGYETFVAALGEPIAAVTDTATYLTFNVPLDVFATWSTTGSFLVKETTAGSGMMAIAPDYASGAPELRLIADNSTSGGSDTTRVTCRESGTAIDIDAPAGSSVVSDADGRGFVLHIGVPEFQAAPVPFHEAAMKFRVSHASLVETSLSVILYLLTEDFTDIESVTTDASTLITIDAVAADSTYMVDITPYLNAWYNYGQTNHGILVKSVTNGTNPQSLIIEPIDSLFVTYSTLPEIE